MADDTNSGTKRFLEWDEPRTQVNKPLKGFRPRPHRAHALIQTDGPEGKLRVVLERELLSIGRAAGSDIHLDNDNVSRNHARLMRIDGEYTLEDLESRNGIYLNGVAVHAAVLRDGDEVQLGDFIFAYQEGT
jgi:pSer/pThr/pTyr-binding forkhead associated (FHA) protein